MYVRPNLLLLLLQTHTKRDCPQERRMSQIDGSRIPGTIAVRELYSTFLRIDIKYRYESMEIFFLINSN